ncbi:CaiB/BaiF CoA-transferase family protein [Paralimibaculum aggregatum]|uniref:CaiB/BaiF CoA-transferase family protein n=1 Tax=Paralimibaculum aggregatum TaxID=3036245 RepID=A0ABQ6LM79_9RHOB|nr:CaiB/BaiF CoA-transferase family protein [Limibaculum sp. NKW23]GMG84303.1 CaiB/BaiF CoA-transferase family protein [Limibaculum sp. NKW23]
MQASSGTGNRPETAERRGPLDGRRVIELGSTVAGPFCGRLLGDFGADVIKIEQREGDAVRSMGKRNRGRSLYAASIFRNKRNVSIDLRRPEGRALARRLCATADVVVENFRPGTLERWGLGYEDLSRENPGLVLVRISGYGQHGPYSQRPGYGVVCEAVSGMREITGDPDRPPARVAVSLTDYITGLYAAFGAALALIERQRTGRGQVVDTALYESAFSFMEPHIPAFQQLGEIARRAGSRLPDNVPNTLFETADRRHIHITAISQTLFAKLMAVIGRPELADDPSFAAGPARAENEAALTAIIAGWVAARPLAEAEAALEAAGIPHARIYDMADIFADPHYRARGAIVTPEDPVLGPVAMAEVVPRLSETPGGVHWPGRDTGVDTLAVLEGELGLSAGEIEALLQSGILFPGEREKDNAAEAGRRAAG